MKQSEIITTIIETNKEAINYMARIDKTLEKLNDTNVLHANILKQQSEVVSDLVSGNKAVMTMFKNAFLVLIIAIIILAGAEQALKYVQY